MVVRDDQLVVIVDKVTYAGPAAVVPALRRVFDTKLARANGETMGSARRIAWYYLVGKIRYQYMRVPDRRDANNIPLDPDTPQVIRQEHVSNVLAERLVRKWLRDGYLEVVTRGRYRRVRVK